MCDGATEEERKEWDLLEAKQFKYLNKSSSYTLTGVDNAAEYRVGPLPDPPCLDTAAQAARHWRIDAILPKFVGAVVLIRCS